MPPQVMSPKFLLVLVVTICSAGLGAAGYHYALNQPAPGKVDGNTDQFLAQFSDYKKWTLVNPEPVLMELAAATDCVLVPGRTEDSPHTHKYISVFVNPTGLAAMMTQRSPRFPPGSMIVKEKLGSKDSQMPEVLTAMLKHEPGYNQESGDWEYLVLNGAGSRIEGRGKLANCQGCHVAYKHSDFVTRTYLPREVVQKLK